MNSNAVRRALKLLGLERNLAYHFCPLLRRSNLVRSIRPLGKPRYYLRVAEVTQLNIKMLGVVTKLYSRCLNVKISTYVIVKRGAVLNKYRYQPLTFFCEIFIYRLWRAGREKYSYIYPISIRVKRTRR